MALDAAGNIYVGNSGNGTITVYGKGSFGNAIPSAIISGPSTGLTNPTGGYAGLSEITVHENHIFVGVGYFGAGGDNAAVNLFPLGANGNIRPERTIEPRTRDRCTCSAGGFAIAPDGRIFTEIGDCLFIYPSSASDPSEPKVLSLPDPEDSVPLCPARITLDSAGNLYALRADSLLEFEPSHSNSFNIKGIVATHSTQVFTVDRDGFVYNISPPTSPPTWSSPGARYWSLSGHSPGGGASSPLVGQIYGPASGLNEPTGIAVWP